MRYRLACWLPVWLVLAGSSGGCLNTKPNTFEQSVANSEPDANVPNRQELAPRDAARACLAVAQALDKERKVPEAIAEYEMARRYNAANNHVCRRLAVLYDRQGNFAKSDEEYEKALAMFPNDADLLNDAGYSHFLRGNWTMAEDCLRQAVQIKPEHKRAWINLGLTLVQRDRVPEALEALCHVVSEAEAHCNIAFGLSSQGKHQAAMAEYRIALQIAPDLERAQLALAKLENPGKTPTSINGSIPSRAQGADAMRLTAGQKTAMMQPVDGFAETRDK